MPRLHVRVLVAVLATALLVPLVVPPAASAQQAAPGEVAYSPPLPGPIVDHFDPPAQRWQAGNRGIDYAPEPGTPVVAAADGEVVFAGSVAGTLHVTVLHADGLRTSYSFLAEVNVRVGQQVRSGDAVGVAGGPVHFGVRDPDDTYLDPEALLAGLLEPRVVLVPGAGEGVDPLAERRSLLDVFIDTGVAATTALAGATVDQLQLAVHYAQVLDPYQHVLRMGGAAKRWWDQRDGCTPEGVAPPRPTERRIAVVVSGLGTTSEGNSAWQIRTDELGYAETVRFSYNGGQAPPATAPAGGLVRVGADDTGLDAIPVTTFGAVETQRPLEDSAAELVDLLRQVAAAEPGVPIDVIAHSQGGVVARLAVEQAEGAGALPGDVENLVTLGSPHGGAPLATGVELLRTNPGGRAALTELRQAEISMIKDLDDRLPSIVQLSETSDVLASVRDDPAPEGVRFTSIGARGDLTVPAQGTVDGAATSHIVDIGWGPDVHGDLAGSDAATREIGLAVAGMGPTCEGLLDAATDFVVSDVIATGEGIGVLNVAGVTGSLPGEALAVAGAYG